MMPSEPLQESQHRFLEQVLLRTGGDAAATVSMYDVGDALHLERAEAKRLAETLIGLEFLEIRTLSGAVGITPAGIDAVRPAPAGDAASAEGAVRLGTHKVPDGEALHALEHLVGTLKARFSEFALDFEAAGELTADIKSIDAQMASPKPKTTVIRGCLESIRDLLEKVRDQDCSARITLFLGY